MKWLIRCTGLFCSILGGIRAMPVKFAGSGDNVSSTIRYVALGDSIAYGYGLQDKDEESYVGLVRQYFEERYDYVVTTNFGKNGMRSGELLDILTNPENENYKKYRDTLSYADVVTLSIGSNDLLHLIKLDFNMEEMIREGGAKFRKACSNFASNFPKIIREIRTINPDVKIYANNIYNPAKGLSSYASVYEVAERYINLLNQAFQKAGGYYLVNIKEAFDKEKKSMINISLKGREIDPHPSKEGHELISEMVIKQIAK